MTLRRRLLLVYLIVVFLSVATVGVAVYELNRTQRIYSPLLTWSDIVADVVRLKFAYANVQRVRPTTQPASAPAEDDEFLSLLAGAQRKMAQVSDYIDIEFIRTWQYYRLYQAYRDWLAAPPESRNDTAQTVNDALDTFDDAVRRVQDDLNEANKEQTTREWVLLGVVFVLTALHVAVLGTLLNRWLIQPMERLNRQVESLAKDQPPPEPLLTSPLEMARLASALDKARESLQIYRQQLIDNERLTTIGQFAAQLTHNLRNPLASIRAAAQVTARHERENTYVRERMDEVIASVDRLNRWIGGLMEIARRDPTPTREADVAPLLHRIGEALRPELTSKEIDFSVHLPAEGIVCAHDPVTLEQALVAMLVNAIEASPLGKPITLRAEMIEPRAALVGPEQLGQNGIATRCCRISVNDDGPGLPPENPERIFDFSYSTKQRGMGLGLALARLALQRQGGEAHACNRPEGGAMVYVDLPIVAATSESMSSV